MRAVPETSDDNKLPKQSTDYFLLLDDSSDILITTTATTMLWPFVWDYPGEPVPEETFTHSHLS